MKILRMGKWKYFTDWQTSIFPISMNITVLKDSAYKMICDEKRRNTRTFKKQYRWIQGCKRFDIRKKLWRTSGIDILHPFPDWRSWKRSPLILKGHNKNREYLKRSRAIYSRLMKNLFKNPNRYYNSTISDGIRAFFKLYDYRYLTHDYIITADDSKKRYDGRSVYLQLSLLYRNGEYFP